VCLYVQGDQPFQFLPPKHLLPPPPPRMKLLLTPLAMRLLIRLGMYVVMRTALFPPRSYFAKLTRWVCCNLFAQGRGKA
jgi:hypothetical protein